MDLSHPLIKKLWCIWIWELKAVLFWMGVYEAFLDDSHLLIISKDLLCIFVLTATFLLLYWGDQPLHCYHHVKGYIMFSITNDCISLSFPFSYPPLQMSVTACRKKLSQNGWTSILWRYYYTHYMKKAKKFNLEH